MKTIVEIIEQYESQALDGRDINRLAQFITEEQGAKLGMKLKEGCTWDEPKPFTKENILIQLKADVDFGFEKALNQRGLSSSMMYAVVSMWNWVLEEGLEDFTDYAQYGLPLFKATAIKYGFTDKIEGSDGDEDMYSTDYGE